jgi:hypothetical protein
MLTELLGQIAPSESLRQTLLVDNPQRLYRFPALLETETQPNPAS